MNITEEIDVYRAIAMLKRAVELKGADFMYEKRDDGECLYVHEETAWNDRTEQWEATDELSPGCLIGTALHLEGVPLSAFIETGMNGEPADAVLGAFEELGVTPFITESAKDMLGHAQRLQDRNWSWGDAVSQATEAALARRGRIERP